MLKQRGISEEGLKRISKVIGQASSSFEEDLANFIWESDGTKEEILQELKVEYPNATLSQIMKAWDVAYY